MFVFNMQTRLACLVYKGISFCYYCLIYGCNYMFFSATTMESWSVQTKILLLTLWWNCVYSLRFVCCIFNLLWSQFWHNLESCNLYFIVDIFRSCLVVFPSTPKDFPCKIWCSCVIVFLWCLLKLFSHIYCYCLIVIYFNSHRHWGDLGFFPNTFNLSMARLCGP